MDTIWKKRVKHQEQQPLFRELSKRNILFSTSKKASDFSSFGFYQIFDAVQPNHPMWINEMLVLPSRYKQMSKFGRKKKKLIFALLQIFVLFSFHQLFWPVGGWETWYGRRLILLNQHWKIWERWGDPIGAGR